MEDFKEKESTSTNKRRESLIENKDRRQKLGNSHDFLLDELSSNPRITSQSEANGSDAMGVSHENAGVVASNVRDVSRCDDDDSNMRVEQDIVQFFTGSCVLQDDLEQHGPAVLSALEAIVDQMEARGEEMYLEHKTKKKVESLSNSNPTFPADKKASGLHANQIDPSIMDRIDPRSYQTALLNIAVKQNTIVHLGTGTGKTLIALLLIREMASSLVDKQTVFLVPSVALAIQQEAALSANLPLSVGTAHGVAVFSPKKRAELAKCNVLVATHGACLALLDNYGDLFQMNKWNLLIIDECHNCTGNSTYVTIMENYYHKKTEVGDRPRVLGLTASPLINVKLNQSEEQLGEKLAELENIMDSTVVSIENLGLAHDDKDKEFLLKEANSIVVEYDPMPSGRVNCWPSADEEGSLYSARRKEFRRLAKLYGDVGPFPVFLYARKLKAELIRNTFEGETQEEFENAILFIADVLHFCRQDQVFNLVSDKLCALENLLKQEIEARSERLAKGVGVVFVQNRITALALNLYFNHRFQALDSKLPWPPSCDLAPAEGQREPLNPSSLRDENGLSTYKKNFALRNNKRENCSRECDQFMDADEDDKFCGQVPLEDATFNQFEDADFGDADSVSPSRYAAEILTHCRDRNLRHETPNLDATVLVRCGSLVRNQNQLFKSLRHDTPPTTEQEKEMSRYFHDEKGEIRKVINDLRFGKINVLVATSVVEEGVDVQACSFVVVFDRLTTLKNYIQMKGRARASDAKFFVFQNRVFDGHSFLALDDARTIDRKMNAVLRTREPTILVGKCDTTDYVEVDVVDTELNAARCGFFGTSLGEVRVGSAKSLLFSFALRQPLDDGTRNSKEALYAHLPSYTIDRDALRLPAFFGSVASTFWLPQFCHDQSKKVKEGTLALMACVRLYQHGLLSERLLPLSRQEVFERIWPKDQPFPSKCHNDTSVSLASIIDGTTLFQYSIRLESKELTPVKRVLNPNNHHLTILTCQCLDDVPNYIHPHRNFGLLKASLQTKQQIVMNRDDMAIVSEFFSAIFNGRWKRRSHSFAFRPVKDDDTMSHIGFYAVGIVNELNILDIELMRLMILESKRDPIERQFAVMSVTNDENLYVPRLWSPQYNDKSTYVAHGPAGKSCGSQFLCNSNQSDVGTYQDYFRVKFGIHVQLDEPLFQCQHLWELPCSYSQVSVTQDSDPSATITKPMKSDVLLPKSLCLETCTVANAGIFLESVVLPQFLFHVERHLTGFLFANFCRTEFPTLGQCLDIANSEEIVGLLSAKSSADHHTYERLEWLGDAVLKLVQTDAILMSLELRDWVSKLHEGELDFIRSGMCCNSHLFSICQRTGFDRFVRTRMLQRGRWSPSSLELFCPNGTLPVDEQPADKVYADVIEAILGFVYTASGYKIARKVAKELGLTPPYAGDANETIDRELVEPKVNFVYGFMLATKKFAGYTTCQKPKLLVEAFTHATDVNSGTSSYQRLEWIGDAVLSLAVRQWIFEAFPFADPGEMVLREEPVITNESLAFLCLRSGLHKYLRHRDQTLPARIELFEAAVQSMGTGLWMSDCYPKPMADLVESVLGYIHCDGGFEAGQKAALFVTSPVLALYQSKATDELRLHPKRRLLEYGGDFFAFEATNNPHLSNPSQPINGSLASVHIDENKNVVVTCLRNGILSLSDSSLSLVTNRASAIIGSVLDNNPALSQRFQLARDKIIKKVKRRVLPKN